MLQKFARICLASVMLIACASISIAQDQPQFKVGDKVEVRNMTSEWVRATVLAVVDWRSSGYGFAYRIHVDDPKAPNSEWNAMANTVRALEKPQNDTPKDNQPVGDNRKTANVGAWKVGDLVDVFYDEGLYGKNKGKGRGTIIEVGDGKYKVHYTGCAAYWDEWVDRTLIRPAATISTDAPEIKFLIGKWSMTTVGISRAAIAWGKSNDIQINGDGSYIWYQSGGKPSVKGKWIADAKVEGAKDGTAKIDGILVKDAPGQEWKLYRRVVKPDNLDKVTIHQMCEGITDIGTRIR